MKNTLPECSDRVLSIFKFAQRLVLAVVVNDWWLPVEFQSDVATVNHVAVVGVNPATIGNR